MSFYSCKIHGGPIPIYNPCPDCADYSFPQTTSISEQYSLTHQSQNIKTDRDLLLDILNRLEELEKLVRKQ